MGPPFATFQQASTVSPPGSVDSWNSYQSPYELNHFNILSPAASPYGSFTGQYGSYVHPIHFDYGSPPRGPGGGGGNVTGPPNGNGGPIGPSDMDDGHHKMDHYQSTMDENHCAAER